MIKCCVCKTNEVPPFAEVHNGVGYDVDFSSGSVCEICDSLIRGFDEFRKYSERIGLQLKDMSVVFYGEECIAVAQFLLDKKHNLTDLEIYSMWYHNSVRGFLLQSEFVAGYIADSLHALYTYSYFPNEVLISDNTFLGYV
jgi:hypothetical protein